MNMYKIKDHPNLSFKLINRVTGWVTFVIASMTYILTAESTASLWDCGEFITTSVGLQVGHPPGAPLFMIISRLFAIFAPSADTQAYMINCMSAICSGLTILFLFWSITHLARKLIVKEGEEMTMGQMFAILGASLIGSLTYTFTDTFWFSAVEGEVYAMSSLFTAVVFWAILKWENVAFERYANRWLILIAYLIGLSIGVHLLNLLAIPAIVFVYYFKKYTPTVRGFIKTGILSVFILGVVNFGIIPGVIKVAGWFELTFVNGMGAPFNTGVIIYVLLIIGALVWGIRYTLKKGMPVWNTILTCFMVILIGYSSYSMIVIRSLSDPPIDEGSPDNVFSLLSYINRDQYGDAPLLYGQYFNAPQVGTKEGEPIYYQNKETGVYEKIGNKTIYEYDKRFCGFFPRMYSDTRPNFANQYQAWAGRNNGPTYTVNGETITRSIIVLPKDFGTVDVEPEPDASDAANTQFRNAVWGLYEAPAREKMWQGGFVNPVESYTTLVDYGQVRVVNGRQGSRSNSTKLYTIPGEPCRAPANGVVVLAAELALTGNTVVIDHGCGMRSYLYGLQTLSVSAGQSVEKGQAVGVLGEELTMDFKLGSKSVNPWPLFQTSGGLFWKENG